MSIWKKKNRILITCPKGVAPYLKSEIEALGFPVVNEIDTAVSNSFANDGRNMSRQPYSILSCLWMKHRKYSKIASMRFAFSEAITLTRIAC